MFRRLVSHKAAEQGKPPALTRSTVKEALSNEFPCLRSTQRRWHDHGQRAYESQEGVQVQEVTPVLSSDSIQAVASYLGELCLAPSVTRYTEAERPSRASRYRDYFQAKRDARDYQFRSNDWNRPVFEADPDTLDSEQCPEHRHRKRMYRCSAESCHDVSAEQKRLEPVKIGPVPYSTTSEGCSRGQDGYAGYGESGLVGAPRELFTAEEAIHGQHAYAEYRGSGLAGASHEPPAGRQTLRGQRGHAGYEESGLVGAPGTLFTAEAIRSQHAYAEHRESGLAGAFHEPVSGERILRAQLGHAKSGPVGTPEQPATRGQLLRCEHVYPVYEESGREVEVEARFDGGGDRLEAHASGSAHKPGVKVADRVKAFESKSKQHSAHTKGHREDTDTKKHGHQPMPLVFPLHVRKFSRRVRDGMTTRAETPLYQAKPDDDPYIHAPLPQRTIPMVRDPVAEGSNSDTDDPLRVAPSTTEEAIRGLPMSPRSFGNEQGPVSSAQSWIGHYQVNATQSPTAQSTVPSDVGLNTFAYFHGTRGKCVRHGRKPSLRGLRTTSGIRCDAEKWGNGSRSLGRSQTMPVQESGNNNDACPDCVAELGIRKRETGLLSRNGESPSLRTVNTMPAIKLERLSRDPHESTLRQADRSGTDSIEVQVADEEQNRPQQTMQSKNVRFRKPSQSSSSSGYSQRQTSQIGTPQSVAQLVTTSDLGDGLDAVILERGGRLEQVVVNVRKGAPTAESLLKLSEELIKVATAIAAAEVSSRSPAVDNAVTSLEEPMVDFNNQQGGITQLLEHIDTATGGLGSGIWRTDDFCVTSQTVSEGGVVAKDFAFQQDPPMFSFDSDDSNETYRRASMPSPMSRLAKRQSIDADYSALRKHFGRGGSYDNLQMARDIGFADRLEDRASRQPLLQSSPLGIGPVDPKSQRMEDWEEEVRSIEDVDDSTSVPRITVTEATLPSHILTAQDLAPPSPLMFTESTCPSLYASPDLSPKASPDDASHRRRSPVQPVGTSETGVDWNMAALGSHTGKKKIDVEEKQVIHQAMRMQRNWAVQEAAAVEREGRRQKKVNR